MSVKKFSGLAKGSSVISEQAEVDVVAPKKHQATLSSRTSIRPYAKMFLWLTEGDIDSAQSIYNSFSLLDLDTTSYEQVLEIINLIDRMNEDGTGAVKAHAYLKDLTAMYGRVTLPWQDAENYTAYQEEMQNEATQELSEKSRRLRPDGSSCGCGSKHIVVSSRVVGGWDEQIKAERNCVQCGKHYVEIVM